MKEILNLDTDNYKNKSKLNNQKEQETFDLKKRNIN